MQFPAHCRCFAMFIIGVGCVAGLSSCSKPTSGNGSSQDYFLEDIGNGICRETRSGLMWQIDASQKFSALQEAQEYADSLSLGGFDDWRLPTRSECLRFSELQEMKRGNCPIKIKRAHWVSDGGKEKPGHWEDYPLCGGSEFRWFKGDKGSVRAVRP